ncbi:hypothetical protein STEG23_020950, partial [Scotinomys teguina]
MGRSSTNSSTYQHSSEVSPGIEDCEAPMVGSLCLFIRKVRSSMCEVTVKRFLSGWDDGLVGEALTVQAFGVEFGSPFPPKRVAMVMVSLHNNRTMTKTEVGTGDWGIAVIGLTVLLFGGIWTLRVWIRKAAEFFKWDLMGHTHRSMA